MCDKPGGANNSVIAWSVKTSVGGYRWGLERKKKLLEHGWASPFCPQIPLEGAGAQTAQVARHAWGMSCRCLLLLKGRQMIRAPDCGRLILIRVSSVFICS